MDQVYDYNNRKSYYEKELLIYVKRLLSQTDRCPLSESRGCMDREYWAWATKDFANMDMQRGVRVLSYLYSVEFMNNIYYKKDALLIWIKEAIMFWIRRQKKSGGFDHLYVNEDSWMAAAFTLVDMIAAFRHLMGKIDLQFKNIWLDVMIKCGEFLINRDESHGFISNHRAGASAALMGLYNITGDKRYEKRAWLLMDEIYKRQSDEGWYLEYEGADPGYQTLDTHYQAVFYLETNKDGRVLESVRRSIDFLSYFIHPDRSIGGEYGSRNCPHFFPGGLEVFASELPISEAVISLGVKGLESGDSCGLTDADTRNEVVMASSYVLALEKMTQGNKACQMPYERVFERVWQEAGIYIRSDEGRYYVFGASKGGVVKIYSKESQGDTQKKPAHLVYSSCGYTGILMNGTAVTSLLWTTSPILDTGGLISGVEKKLADDREIKADVKFYRFQTDRLMSPVKFLLFRIFNITIGRSYLINSFIRRHIIIGRYIKSRKEISIKLDRSIIFKGQSCKIKDKIILSKGLILRDFREHGFFSTVYMASARYFRRQDLIHAWSSEGLSGQFNLGVLTREVEINNEKY